MKFKKILIIGTGQIGKAILDRVYEFDPEEIHIHNLTEEENFSLMNSYLIKQNVKYSYSYGNVFMPYKLKDLTNKNLLLKSSEVIKYFYQDINENIIKQSMIYFLVENFKPNLIIDAINTATVLGGALDCNKSFESYEKNPKKCCEELMVNDFTSKLINFVTSLKYSMEKFNVEKYIKVSTTGLGGMGLNMPYTHGDNPKFNLSNALMGKISASGVLHQLLWSLSHTKNIDISVVIPATFVGIDSVKDEPIETDKGILKLTDKFLYSQVEIGKELGYSDSISNKDLKYLVVRAGENHVYSINELKTLTALGQMEAITKEEVADAVVKDIKGTAKSNVFEALDKYALKPTYLGHMMVNEIIENFEETSLGIATGNLGVKISKELYELFCFKQILPKLSLIYRNNNIDNIVSQINEYVIKNEKLIKEIVSLGIPIITDDNKIIIGNYSIVPNQNQDKTLTHDNINNWAEIGWVDLRKSNIKIIIKNIIKVAEFVKEAENDNFKRLIDINNTKIEDDYDIAELLACFYNIENKGRKKNL